MADPILIVPCTEKGRGGGHLIRSAALTRDLRQKGREAFLCINAEKAARASSTLALVEGFDASWICTSPPDKAALVIIDGFRTSREDFEKWAVLAPVLGIDEGGNFRGRFDFLVDLLPGVYGRPNLTAPNLLPLPKNRRAAFSLMQNPPRILISFGAEDAAGLGLPAAESLSVNRPEKIPELREHLAEYDLLITHYGLTAFEALHARLPVLLVSPTRYHEKLARKAGLVSAGTGKRAAGRLGRLVFMLNKKTGQSEPNRVFLEKLARSCEAAAVRFGLHEAPENSSPGDYLTSVTPFVSRQCRVCGNSTVRKAKGSNILARFPERSYRRCKKCGLIGMDRLTAPPIEYSKDYFFDFYKKQYGKTYLEDFPSLVEAGRRRVKTLKGLLPMPGGKAAPARPRLLDIGCAYGPFLAAAKAEGFDPEGIEPTEDAARYVREELGIPCKQGFFAANTPAPEGYYDAVCLWYVIEHFEAPGTVLDEISRILKPGGVLAFSTPSFSGISGRKSLNNFLKNSPADHWTVWSPAICRKILRNHGFALKTIANTGHHPERFPLIGKRLKTGGVIYGLCMRLSRIFRLGDSFEVYAVKTASGPN